MSNRTRYHSQTIHFRKDVWAMLDKYRRSQPNTAVNAAVNDLLEEILVEKGVKDDEKK